MLTNLFHLDPAVPAAAVLVALALDRLWGEPPVWMHPVVGMGRYLGTAGRRVSRAVGATPRPGAEFWGGAMAWCLGAGLVVAVAFGLFAVTRELAPVGQVVLLGLLLKPLLSWRMLREEVKAVEQALATSLDAGRERVSWLVSRDVTRLSEAQVAALKEMFGG